MSSSEKHTLNPDKWIEKYADYLYNYALVRVDNRDLSKDLVQETFYSGLKGMANFKGLASERTWLISILKRKIIDYYRKINSKKGQKEVRVNFYESGEKKGSWLEERVPIEWGNEAEKKIENQELKNVLDLCIENLPEKYRMVFLLKSIQRYETEEICNELNISASNLWVIIHRARQQLRRCLEDKWYKN